MTQNTYTSEQMLLGGELIAACREAHADAVKDLLLQGADPNYNYPGQVIPLLALVCPDRQDKSAMLECLDLLIGAGVEVNIESSGETPLVAVARYHNPQALEKLIVAGAEVNTADVADLPLGIATKGGCVKNMEVLVRYGADINLPDPEGKSALEYARIHGFGDISVLLLDYHAEQQARKQAQEQEKRHQDDLLVAQKYRDEIKARLRPVYKFKLKKS